MGTADSYQNVLLALAVWREARGSTAEAKAGIKHSILNRVAQPAGPYHHCRDIISNILCPAQFSSFSRKDANAVLLPDPSHGMDWAAWLECCAVVDTDQPDPTGGADTYYSIDIEAPAYDLPDKFTAQIDRFRFFKLY